MIRVLRLLLATVLLMPSLTVAARERPTVPSPRTVDYDWMSAATWRQKHEANVARAAQGGCDILLLGDSITEGWNSTTLWQDKFPSLSVVNFGIGGDTTANLLWRLENGELGNLRPRIVVLMIGTNNLGRNEDDPPKVVNGIQAIISLLHSRLPSAKIFLLGIPPADQEPKTKMRKRIAEANRRMAQNLDDGHSILFHDLGPVLLEPDGRISPEIMADFLHPTPAGYQRMADVIFPKIDRLLHAR